MNDSDFVKLCKKLAEYKEYLHKPLYLRTIFYMKVTIGFSVSESSYLVLLSAGDVIYSSLTGGDVSFLLFIDVVGNYGEIKDVRHTAPGVIGIKFGDESFDEITAILDYHISDEGLGLSFKAAPAGVFFVTFLAVKEEVIPAHGCSCGFIFFKGRQIDSVKVPGVFRHGDNSCTASLESLADGLPFDGGDGINIKGIVLDYIPPIGFVTAVEVGRPPCQKRLWIHFPDALVLYGSKVGSFVGSGGGNSRVVVIFPILESHLFTPPVILLPLPVGHRRFLCQFRFSS